MKKGILFVFLLIISCGYVFGAEKLLNVYDLEYIHKWDRYKPIEAEKIWDHMHFVTSLQGNVNRDGINLYIIFMGNEFGDDGDGSIDKYWLKKMTSKGEWLEDYKIENIDSMDMLIKTFRKYINGLVVYDDKVPSTSNIASTVAGCENLAAIRYDTDQDSLYYYLTTDSKGPKLPVKKWLINKDGTSLFTGNGIIPGTDIKSTGSAKGDSYIWAKVKYLDSGKCSAYNLAYYLDCFWIKDGEGRLAWPGVVDHDFIIKNRGFVFDLSPWGDETPRDDKNQALGTDYRIFKDILLSAYKRNKGECFPLSGFIPYTKKYSNIYKAGGSHDPVAGEWKVAELISNYNCFKEAEGQGMANGSIFCQFKLKDKYTQKKPTIADLKQKSLIDENGRIKETTYIWLYAGDYDSADWMYEKLPRIWDDPNRGKISIGWAFNPNLSRKFAYGYDYFRRTAALGDTFIAGDCGAGYINPSLLSEPRKISGLPDGVAAWTRHNEKLYNKFDLSVTGFVIEGNSNKPMSESAWDAYAKFSFDGMGGQKVSPDGIYKGMPFVRHNTDMQQPYRFNLGDAELAMSFTKKSVPEFIMIRTIIWDPSSFIKLRDELKKGLDGDVEILEPYEFFLLMKYFYENGGEKRPINTKNLFDIRGNAKVIDSSPVIAGFDIRDLFGGSYSSGENFTTIFADGIAAGFPHFAELELNKEAKISRLKLQVRGDGATRSREYKEFRLLGKSKINDSWKLIYTYIPAGDYPTITNHNIVSPIDARFYRVEFLQSDFIPSMGPRVIELEAYED